MPPSKFTLILDALQIYALLLLLVLGLFIIMTAWNHLQKTTNSYLVF